MAKKINKTQAVKKCKFRLHWENLEGHETRWPTNSEQQYSKGVTHVFHNW